MPFDAVCLRAVLYELSAQLVGSRVDKIYQPSRDEIVLSVRAASGNHKLLLTANPSHPRIQFTAVSRDNPATPPMFCMLLRKHLTGARVVSVTQPPMERVVDIELEALDELGVRAPRHLILEAMGRHSNLILTGADGRIIDCLRRVDAEMSEQRQVLPGLFYRLPPAQADKCNPLDVAQQELAALYAAAADTRKIFDYLLDHFAGLSPLICREMAFLLTGDVDGRLNETDETAFLRVFFALMQTIARNDFAPTLLERDGRPLDFTYCPILQYGLGTSMRRFDSFAALLDCFYAERENNERIAQRGAELIRAVTNLRARCARKLDAQRRELAQAEDRDTYRIRGDLITANLYAMQKGMRQLKCRNYYDPECAEIVIPLDPLLTPQQNAAMCYRRYTKAKTAERVLTEQIARAQADLDYLDSVLTCIHCSSEERDLNEIRQELEDNGYLKAKRSAKKQMKRPKSRPLEFMSTNGMRISVGRNNTQNDLLTCKMAGKTDVWLHTKDIHGAHVILWTQGAQADAQSLCEAAQLAAWFSQGKDDKNVAVDYAQVRHVKKPNGAKPGKVIYTNYSTLYATPERELVQRLGVKQ